MANDISKIKTPDGVVHDLKALSLYGPIGQAVTKTAGDYTFAYYPRVISSTAGIFPTNTDANAILTFNKFSGNYYSQLGFSGNGFGRIYYRNFDGVAINTTNPWSEVVVDHNNPSDGQGDVLLRSFGYLSGKPLRDDPTFLVGNGDVAVYNNAANGNVTLTRDTYSNFGISSPGIGTNYVLRIRNIGSASPSLGGFYCQITTRANAQFLQVFRAKIPAGYTVNMHNNPYGTYGTQAWLTSDKGTGKWEWYVRKITCGEAGTFSTTGYVAFSGTAGTASSPVDFYLAYHQVYNLTDQTYNGALRSRFADALIGEAPNSVTYNPGKTKFGYSVAVTSGTAGMFTATDDANAILTIHRWYNNDSNYCSQLGFSSDGNLYYRSFGNSALDTTTAWKQILTSGDAATSVTAVSTTSATGTSTNYARQDHAHNISLATGDSNGQVKIAGTNISVKGLAELAYTHNRLFTTNPFAGGRGSSSLYISKIDNGLYRASDRYDVTATIGGAAQSASTIAVLFDGSYETFMRINNGQTAVITIDTSNKPWQGNYPYGVIYLSFYHVCKPTSVSCRIYNTYSSQGAGWHDVTCTKIVDGTTTHMYSIPQNYYRPEKIEITIVGDTTNEYGYTALTQVEMWLQRPDPHYTPFVSKYYPETLYSSLTAPEFIENGTSLASKYAGISSLADFVPFKGKNSGNAAQIVRYNGLSQRYEGGVNNHFMVTIPATTAWIQFSIELSLHDYNSTRLRYSKLLITGGHNNTSPFTLERLTATLIGNAVADVSYLSGISVKGKTDTSGKIYLYIVGDTNYKTLSVDNMLVADQIINTDISAVSISNYTELPSDTIAATMQYNYNPMTTAYDIIVGGTNGVPTRLAKGSNGTFLGINSSGVISWLTPSYLPLSGGALIGDVTLATGKTIRPAAATNACSLGTASYPWNYVHTKGISITDAGEVALPFEGDGFLKYDQDSRLYLDNTAYATAAHKHGMTSANDIIIGGSGGTPTRLAKGSNNTFLGINSSGNIAWGTPGGTNAGHTHTLKITTVQGTNVTDLQSNTTYKLVVGNASYQFKTPTDYTCLAEGTKILMADNSEKNIEDVVAGDIIMSYDPNTEKLCEAVIIDNIHTGRSDDYVNYYFDDGSFLSIFGKHCIYSADEGTARGVDYWEPGWKTISADGKEVMYIGSENVHNAGRKRHFDLHSSNKLYFANGILNAQSLTLDYPMYKDEGLPEEYITALKADFDSSASLHTHQFDKKTGSILAPILKELKAQKKVMDDNKKLLADSDYLVAKFTEGLISAAEWLKAKAERAGWRSAVNKAEPLYAAAEERYKAFKAKYAPTNTKRERFNAAVARDNACLDALKAYYKSKNELSK